MKNKLFGLAIYIFSASTIASTVWDKTITHPLATGWVYSPCSFGKTTCAGNGTHLGVDVMAASGEAVVAMCDGIVKHNNTADASIWNSKVIVEHNCGGQFQKIYGYYGHVASELEIGESVASGETIGTLKNDGSNSHLHMGVGYLYQESSWGYGTSTTNWLDFQDIVYRSPTKPVLRAPILGNSTGTSVSFSWDAVTDAKSYRIVISQDPNPLRNFDNQTRACNGTPNGGAACWTNPDSIITTDFSREFSQGKIYYWVVRANNSDWSDIGVFTTGATAGPSIAKKAEGILNCIEGLLPSYFPPHQTTAEWPQKDGTIAYGRSYRRTYQAVWNNYWFYNLGGSWYMYPATIEELKQYYCPSAW